MSRQNRQQLLSVLNANQSDSPRDKWRKISLSYRLRAEPQDVKLSEQQSRAGIQFYLRLDCRKYSAFGTETGIQKM